MVGQVLLQSAYRFCAIAVYDPMNWPARFWRTAIHAARSTVVPSTSSRSAFAPCLRAQRSSWRELNPKVIVICAEKSKTNKGAVEKVEWTEGPGSPHRLLDFQALSCLVPVERLIHAVARCTGYSGCHSRGSVPPTDTPGKVIQNGWLWSPKTVTRFLHRSSELKRRKLV